MEIRSVNHRGLDLKSRRRGGRVLRRRDRARGARRGRARRRHRVRAGRVRGRLGGRRRGARPCGPRRARTAAAGARDRGAGQPSHRRGVPDAGTNGALEGEALWETLRPAIEAALGELCATRKQEGRALAADIRAHQERLVDLAARLRQGTAPLAESSLAGSRRSSKRCAGQPGFDPGRRRRRPR